MGNCTDLQQVLTARQAAHTLPPLPAYAACTTTVIPQSTIISVLKAVATTAKSRPRHPPVPSTRPIPDQGVEQRCRRSLPPHSQNNPVQSQPLTTPRNRTPPQHRAVSSIAAAFGWTAGCPSVPSPVRRDGSQPKATSPLPGIPGGAWGGKMLFVAWGFGHHQPGTVTRDSKFGTAGDTGWLLWPPASSPLRLIKSKAAGGWRVGASPAPCAVHRTRPVTGGGGWECWAAFWPEEGALGSQLPQQGSCLASTANTPYSPPTPPPKPPRSGALLGVSKGR